MSTTEEDSKLVSNEEDSKLVSKYIHDIENEKQKRKHQQKLFWVVLILSVIFIICALYLAVQKLENYPTTQEVAILGLIVTAPIILVLALLRYVYDEKKSDNPQPTLMLNVAKELVGVLKAILKK